MDLFFPHRRLTVPKAHEDAAPGFSRLLLLAGMRLRRAAAGFFSLVRTRPERPRQEQAGETSGAPVRVRRAGGSARAGRGFFRIQPASGRNGSPRTVCFSRGGEGAAAGISPGSRAAGREQALKAAESRTARRMRRFPETLFDVAAGAHLGKGGAAGRYILCPAVYGDQDNPETDGAGLI